MLTLPVLPVGTQTVFTLKTLSRDLTPTMGGPQQRVLCGGDRFNVQVQSQALDYVQAMAFSAMLLQGLTSKVRLPLRQDGFDTSKAGSPSITGGGGLSLSISGAGQILPGQFFNVVHGGIAYLHLATAAFAGSGVLPIFPMLRCVPGGGDSLIFDHPVIEGFLDNSAQQWSVGQIRNVGLNIAVTEAA